MDMIVSETNRDKINEGIAQIEGRATTRRIRYVNVRDACEKIESTLGIPKKYMEGISYSYDHHAQKFPRAYKYIPDSTHCVLTYRGGKWRVSDVKREWTRRAGHEFEVLVLPDEAMDAIIRRAKVF